MPVKHIVFDIGRVLVRWDPELPYRKLIADDARRAWFLSQVCNDAWNREQDRGRTWVDGEAELITRFPDEADLIRAFRLHWPQMLPGPVDGTADIMRRLIADGWDVTLLTNFNQETYPIAVQMYPFLNEARGATVSGRIALIKPDLAIFHHHAETFGLLPSETIFFDDSPANVAGATAAGWRAHLFTDAQQMRADLASAGVRLS